LINNIRHTGLVVFDLDFALFFWVDLLGFNVVKKSIESGDYIDAVMGLKDVNVTTVKLEAPDKSMLELLHFNSHKSEPNWKGNPFSTGFTHIAISVKNIDKLCEKLFFHGIEFSEKPQINPELTAKVMYIRGPEGVLIELVETIRGV